MKNISTIVSAVLLTSTIYAQNINITTGWQLVGTQTAYSNMDNLNKSCIDLVWKYNKNTSTWSAYSPDNNTAQLIADSTTIDTLNNINENDGFWVKANSDCSIVNESVVSDNNISIETGFTQEYLNTHDFYVIQDDDSHIKRFRNGYIYHAGDENGNNILDFDANVDMSYTPDSTYTIEDGVLKAIFGDNPTLVIFQILKVNNKYLELKLTRGIDTKNVKYYTDKIEAKAELQSRTISVENGFGEKWLDGRTLYTIITDTEDDNNNGSTTDKMMVAISYSNGNNTLDFDADGQNLTSADPYLLINGVLKINDEEDSSWEQWVITAIDETAITTTLTTSWSSSATEYMFTTKASAQAYLDSL
jgi:hypothetical protein